MSSARQMTILGRAGKAPDLRQTQGGTSVTSVSVATELYDDDQTVWVSVTAWGQTAEYVAEYCDKGDYVYAQGTPSLDEWEGNVELELDADEVTLPNVGGGSGGGSEQPPPPSEPQGEGWEDGAGGDIPF
jgi:single-strand DNA-binding protein